MSGVDAETLLGLHEGDVIESPSLMPGLDSGETIVWQVLESVWVPDKRESKANRITLHAYWHDVFLFPAVVMIDDEKKQHWRLG